MVGEHPVGTVTLLFTDIEGSTKFWDRYPEPMGQALAQHDQLLRSVIESEAGTVFKTVGDAFCAVFPTAFHALKAAVRAQIEIRAEPWPVQTPIKVRMAIHTGSVQRRDSDYFGPALNRVARLLATAHGGQILLSHASAELVQDALIPPLMLRSMGEHRLKDLGRPERVHQAIHPHLQTEFGPLKSLDNPDLQHNLPQQVTSLVGREKELAAIQLLLERTRLLSLTGAGGSGKTRLALQTAAEQLELYPDGVWFVELAQFAQSGVVLQAVSNVLTIQEERGVPIFQTILESLKSRKLLLVLDNCEHLVSECATLSDAIIRHCPDVKIVCTTREALGIAGEQTYRVPSLGLPDANESYPPELLCAFEAVQLFLDRAHAVQPEFRITLRNCGALASLCIHLDGIPLAIELAAARIRSLSVEEIESKLDRRFRLLTGGSRTALPRQQTLSALVNWSYELLGDQEREALRQLSVFAGGWSVAMAERTCGDPIDEFEVLDLLTALVDKSLVNYESGETSRYWFYESVREFAKSRLSEDPETERACMLRHVSTMVSFGCDAIQKLRTVEEPEALRMLDRNLPNFVSAICVADQHGSLNEACWLRLCVGACHQRKGYPREGVGVVDEALVQITASPSSVEPELQVKLLCERVALGLDLLEDQASAPFAARALELARELGQADLVIRSLNLLGQVELALGRFQLSRAHFEEAIRSSQLSQDWIEVARLQTNMCIVERRDPVGDKELAAEHCRAALAIQREHGHLRGEAETLNTLGVLTQTGGNISEASELYLQAARIEASLSHGFGVAKTLSNYGEAQALLGRHRSALRAFLVAEKLFGKLRSPYADYTAKLLKKSAAAEEITEPQLERLRTESDRTEVNNAVAAILQSQ